MSPSKGVLFYGPPVLVRPCLPRPSRTSAMRTLRWVVSISHMFTSRCWLSAGSWAPHDVVQWIRSKCPRSFRLSPCCRSLRHVSWFTWWHHVLLGMMHLLYILGCLLLLGGFILHLTFDQLVARSEPRCELWNGAISDRSYPISYVIIIWSPIPLLATFFAFSFFAQKVTLNIPFPRLKVDPRSIRTTHRSAHWILHWTSHWIQMDRCVAQILNINTVYAMRTYWSAYLMYRIAFAYRKYSNPFCSRYSEYWVAFVTHAYLKQLEE